MLDSVVRYEYNSAIDSSPLTKTIYNYNGRGLKIKQFEFKRGTEYLWEDSVKFEWTYDESGNITSEIKSTWYPYDPSCYPDEYNNCDRNIPTWVFDFKNIWNYNSRNKLTLIEKYVWSLDQKRWIGDVSTVRLEYIYNEKDSLISSNDIGDEILMKAYVWNDLTNQ